MFLNMTEKEVSLASKMSSKRRYELTIREAARLGGLWGLWGPDGWVAVTLADGKSVAPVWPGAEFVRGWQPCGRDGCSPKWMDLDYFLDRWVNSVMNMGRQVVVFPVEGDNGLTVNPLKIEFDIREQEAEYYDAA
jgi:Protein of unknown function (DUF2750)